MNEYTPTTEDVREDFAFPWYPDQIGDRTARVAAFDRWLSEHDRQVAERAWDEGVELALNFAKRNPDGVTLRLEKPNPYRKEPVMEALDSAPTDALREVKAQAWREGWDASERFGYLDGALETPLNPYLEADDDF